MHITIFAANETESLLRELSEVKTVDRAKELSRAINSMLDLDAFEEAEPFDLNEITAEWGDDVSRWIEGHVENIKNNKTE